MNEGIKLSLLFHFDKQILILKDDTVYPLDFILTQLYSTARNLMDTIIEEYPMEIYRDTVPLGFYLISEVNRLRVNNPSDASLLMWGSAFRSHRSKKSLDLFYKINEDKELLYIKNNSHDIDF